MAVPLEFNVRGGKHVVLANSVAEAMRITSQEWDDARARLIEYEGQGPNYRANWALIFPADVRLHYEMLYMNHGANPAFEDIFGTEPSSPAVESPSVIDTLKELSRLAGDGSAVDDQTMRETQATAALLVFVRDIAQIIPVKGERANAFQIKMVDVLKEFISDPARLLAVLRDADKANAVNLIHAYRKRIEHVDPYNFQWTENLKARLNTLSAERGGDSKLSAKDIAMVQTLAVMDLEAALQEAEQGAPGDWKRYGKAATAASGQGAVSSNAATASGTGSDQASLHAISGYDQRSHGYQAGGTGQSHGSGYYPSDQQQRGRSRSRSRDRGQGGSSSGGNKYGPGDQSRRQSSGGGHGKSDSYGGSRRSSWGGESKSHQGGDRNQGRGRSRSPSTDSRGNSTKKRGPSPMRGQGSAGPKIYCEGCGGTHAGGKNGCRYKSHADFNMSDSAWTDSDCGQRLAALGHDKLKPGFRWMIGRDGKPMLMQLGEQKAKVSARDTCTDLSGKLIKHHITNECSNEHCDISALFGSKEPKPMKLSRSQKRRAKRTAQPTDPGTPFAELHNGEQTSVLLDSGATERNFVTKMCCDRLNLNIYRLHHPIFVHSIHGIEEATEVARAQIKVHAQGEEADLKWVELVVIENAPADIIIGLPTLRDSRVFASLSRHFNTGQAAGETREKTDEGPRTPVSWKRVKVALTALGASKAQKRAFKKAHITELLHFQPEDDPTEGLLPEDIWASYLQDPNRAEDRANEAGSRPNYKVFGTPEEQRALNALLDQYADIFATKVGSTAAKISPMSIDVDVAAWHNDKRSHEPTRVQTAVRKAAIERWIRQALADNVIRPSQATAWSQLHLTPKKDGTWRFNVDYRALNKYMRAARSIIPNIGQMLRHIGSQAPKYFGSMDMTSGFHQAAIEESSRHLTAFAAGNETYEFCRVSMGLMNAPWYFQQALAKEVFPRLIHNCMELYIDDILTWGQSFEELLRNLGRIFTRLREHNLTVNPDKCSFGMQEVEFVGHVIDQYGITFSHKKLDKIRDMVRPETKGELKTFLGAAGYMQRHVEGYERLMDPLREFLGDDYRKSRAQEKLQWTDGLKKAYDLAQKAVIQCKKLTWLRPGAELRVYTDASNHGIGAYLCQVIDGEEQPVEFISKSLTKTERRWATIEQEAYAIFYALRKWEQHLRDVHFTVYTDHKNLTYIDKELTPKIVRWKLAVQEYKFDVVHIPGEQNVVADALSRLCTKNVDKDVEMREDSIKASLHSLVVAPELNDWIYDQAGEEQTRDLYWLDAEDDIAAFHGLEATKKRRNRHTHGDRWEKATHVPKHQWDLIAKCHNAEIGHWGVNRTLELLHEMMEQDPSITVAQWPAMRRDVDTYIKKCDLCQKTSEQKLRQYTRKYATSTYGVFENIAIDAVQMPTSTAGYKYILTLIDTFTRYTVLKPIKDMSAQTAAKAMIEYMCVYGAPNQIRSDNSTEFMQVFKEMVDILRTENYKIQPYSHEENSIVERANKEIRRHMRPFMHELRKRNTWENEYLKVQAILNERVSEATGLKPNEIVFVGKVDLHAGRLFPRPTVQQRRTMSQFMQDQIDMQEQLIDIMDQQQDKTDEAHTKGHVEPPIYKIGDYVIAKHEGGVKSKMDLRYHGPYRITHVVNRPQGAIYTVFSAKDSKEYDYHEQFVKLYPCNTDFGDMDALKLSVLDDDMYIVDKILGHKYNSKQQLELLILWYGNKEGEWNLYNKSMIHNILVHQYFRANNLTNLIPAQHRKRGIVVDTPTEKRVRFTVEKEPVLEEISHK
jgi:cleavage and polyadenylation specificity factor subunit 1